jgi:hypothetical protein
MELALESIICLYIDDLLIFETNLEFVHSKKWSLAYKFDMNDMGEAKVIF